MRNRVPEQIERAIQHFGSPAEMARRIGAAEAFVWQWRKGTKQVPAPYCNAIERESGKVVTRTQLRPDDYWEQWPDLKAPRHKLAKAA